LQDGSEVAGFVCEGYAAALDGAEDVSEFGGWRAYLEHAAAGIA
jgi:allophanate hydrolase